MPADSNREISERLSPDRRVARWIVTARERGGTRRDGTRWGTLDPLSRPPTAQLARDERKEGRLDHEAAAVSRPSQGGPMREGRLILNQVHQTR